MQDVYVDDSAQVSDHSVLGDRVKVWGLARIREFAKIGAGSIVGQSVYVGPGVEIGSNCKIQNFALIYEPAKLGDGVFIGPGAILTNDVTPRAITPEGNLKTADDWDSVGVVVEEGASVGAGAVCVAPVTVGAWAMVAAGSVVTADVPRHAMVMGVPARQKGWVGKSGKTLLENGEFWVAPADNLLYKVVEGQMTVVGLR